MEALTGRISQVKLRAEQTISGRLSGACWLSDGNLTLTSDIRILKGSFFGEPGVSRLLTLSATALADTLTARVPLAAPYDKDL